MERFEEVFESMESVFPTLLGLEADLRFASSSLATATLVVLLLCSTREGLAEPGAAGGGMGRGSSTTAVVMHSNSDAAQVPSDFDLERMRRARELDALLAVRGGTFARHAPADGCRDRGGRRARTGEGPRAEVRLPQEEQ